MADTALGRNTIISSLRQEAVRRLVNSSIDLPVDEKRTIIKRFAQGSVRKISRVWWLKESLNLNT